MTATPKTADEIDGMRTACRLASEVLDYLTPFVKTGTTTMEIDPDSETTQMMARPV